jgi:hypothetical protein
MKIEVDLRPQLIHIVFAEDREIKIIDPVYRVVWSAMTSACSGVVVDRALTNVFADA